jgi:DNA-binding response OmpR family regulator
MYELLEYDGLMNLIRIYDLRHTTGNQLYLLSLLFSNHGDTLTTDYIAKKIFKDVKKPKEAVWITVSRLRGSLHKAGVLDPKLVIVGKKSYFFNYPCFSLGIDGRELVALGRYR